MSSDMLYLLIYQLPPSHPDANVDWIPSRRRLCCTHVSVWIDCSVCDDSAKSYGLHFSFSSHSRWKRSFRRVSKDECQLLCRLDRLAWAIGWLWHILQTRISLIKFSPNNNTLDQMLPSSLSWLTFEILFSSLPFPSHVSLSPSQFKSVFDRSQLRESQLTVSVVFRRYFRSAFITSKDRTSLVSIEARNLSRGVRALRQFNRSMSALPIIYQHRSIDRSTDCWQRGFQFFFWPVTHTSIALRREKRTHHDDATYFRSSNVFFVRTVKEGGDPMSKRDRPGSQ